MNSKLILSVAAVVIVAAAIAIVLWTHPGQAPVQGGQSANASGSPAGSGSAAGSSRTLFSSTQYSQYSYQIYPGQLSQQAQAAMAGFNMTSSVLQNSSIDVTITLSGSGQQESITLEPGYRLYIVEGALGDDSFHSDYSLGDDGFVIVDQNGYVV